MITSVRGHVPAKEISSRVSPGSHRACAALVRALRSCAQSSAARTCCRDCLGGSERPRGVFSRQLILGDALDTSGVKASYDAGVLTLRIPVAEKTKPRRIEIETGGKQRQEISA
ncbi:Hsp20 family protein [Arthrobacter sp. NPDC080031]|uniref:Hsp20/alpha crystallin family protein n=1 Tax=Arthrobacter sp. NPDC080031 TaxID=3155918 RepID=UPI003450F3E1